MLWADLSFLSFYFVELHHSKDVASLQKYKYNDLKAFSDARAAIVQPKATSNDFCFSANKSVATKPVSFRDEALFYICPPTVRGIKTAPAALHCSAIRSAFRCILVARCKDGL